VDESNGTVHLTVGVIEGSLAVPVTLHVQLSDGSATGLNKLLSAFIVMYLKLKAE